MTSGKMKNAFKKVHDFAQRNPERYLMFLKRHFIRTEPTFRSVVDKRRVDTSDGEMYAVTIADDIDNPDYDAIAECVINGETIYLWNDHCWAVAVDKDGKEIKSRQDPWYSSFTMKPEARKRMIESARVTVLLFRIGIDPVE